MVKVNPTAINWHDKWLEAEEEIKAQRRLILGLVTTCKQARDSVFALQQRILTLECLVKELNPGCEL